MTKILVASICAALALSACGKKAPPVPPGPVDQITYPKVYPTQ